MQRKHFLKKILDLSQGKPLDKTSKIYSLNPELYTHGLLRLKGRLYFSDHVFGGKHPWLLPNIRYCKLVTLQSHNKLFHAGVETTLAHVRERFCGF
ncbi:integrase catalytic domain-containing protein [Trichonephila inaurata madagascariensis]|uniref:Integrase catalytic domain-containing protein n=1 Tax=Trichonephila inaurata madagascariensis TaxID=2747483 RepID=A0A8X6K7P9_9ARAC|nr:integrase catalytic domain-containing protein [Trichonephila inaurata madagascariensis]